MITFILSIVALILGYLIYGKFVEKKFGVDPDLVTPAIAKKDGVDFVPMNWKKIFLIQFLNIAGLGPIFGAIAGALWGPVAFIWIVVGCIFAGGVHDYFSGMLSVRHGGASIPEVVGKYLGSGFKKFMRVFSVILLVLVGVVFIKGPAAILTGLTGVNVSILIGGIFLYYLLATMIPIDKLIGKIYPIFGISLLVMAFGIAGALILGDHSIPELTATNFANMHANPSKFVVFPMLFITIACGAISGFHATQSPLMARCMTNEKQGRKIFYGTMISEGIVAMIWAAAAMTFFGGVRELGETMGQSGHNAAWVVNEICGGLLGKIGGVLAIFGVVAAPITSGDTAFRSARLTIADSFGYSQKKLIQRLAITLPLFAIGFLLTQVNFAIIWRYFGWANQTLATIVLWTAAMYMVTKGRSHWFATIPATFMTAVVTTYILIAPEGFHVSQTIAYTVGILTTIATLSVFLYVANTKMKPELREVKVRV
ncbi:carbon starvation protein A [Ancylomarina euxinus]|uniref:Carbon starvation protein A n=1 Tax=Ancylomarina euxinus TaxID=2283627 RepID=A0A425Y2A8_9BACT|nr:carbon starvation protein A [Ancylomarina euxinus]MCZ4695058.1 carbon starvation protein A [Ancylomarina euxinus]MUP15006.1 carbon starvation protein A [Ancylomarina euxinus]RRG21946.1 carbon starvation protein A [Ancylomarina euxinus]